MSARWKGIGSWIARLLFNWGVATPDSDEAAARTHPRGGAVGQIGVVVGAWFAYSLARSESGNDVVEAINRGRKLAEWDRWLGFGWTLDVNNWITHHGLFAIPLTMEYASLHYLVTPLVLVWLWRWHPETYRPALYALLTMSAIGLAVYVILPVAPPRLLPNSGWIDTMSSWSGIGWWGAGASAPAGLEHLTDQFAAMPSLHVGWAVWCAWAWSRSGGTFAQRFGWLYPTLVAVTVIVTANHYVLDVAVGACLALFVCTILPHWLAPHSRVARMAIAPRIPRSRQPQVVLDADAEAQPTVAEKAPVARVIDLRDSVDPDLSPTQLDPLETPRGS